MSNPAVRGRIATYWIVGIGLTVAYFPLRNLSWQGGAELHTLMETVATILALIVGAMALVRFYSRGSNTVLLIGTGFLGTALLDGYHAIVTASYFAPYFQSDPASPLPWSWIASRLFLSLMLLLSWLAWRRESRLGEAGLLDRRTIYLGTAMLTVASFIFFAFVPLPRVYFPQFNFHRPEEIVPAAFFLAALIGYLRKGAWRYDPFEHWLVLSLIVGVVGQVVFMSLSEMLFDFEFDAAHLLKKASYICVLTGLLISMFVLFRQVEEGEARMQAVLASTVDGIITIDDRGIMESFNPASERIFGYAAGECIGRNVKMLMPDPDRTAHDSYIGNFLRTGEAKIIGIGREVVGLHKDGREFPMDLGVGRFQLGQKTMFVGVVRDVTDRRRAQDEITAVNTELESFAYSVSHDLRSPLRAIDGFSQALEEDYAEVFDDEGRKHLDRIRAAAQRMGQLIDDLLNLSRVTRSQIVRQLVDLSAIADEVAQTLREADPERDAEFEIAPELRVWGDPRLLRIVLENLIGNAWKFTSGRPRTRIEFGVTFRDNVRTFFVRDNGAGFDMEYAEKLFRPFQRLHSAGEFEGTGIGLATVARIVRRHGGIFFGEGVVNEGAALYFTIAT